MGVDDDDRVAVAARRLLAQLVHDEVQHQRRLAHARARHVEVVAAQQVAREVHRAALAGRRLPDVRAARDAARRGQQHLRARAGHERRLILRPGRVPERRRLAHAEHAAAPQQAGAGGVHGRALGDDRPHPARPQARARGMVVVAVGGGHRLKQLLRAPPAPLRVVAGHDRDELDVGLEGDARDLLLDQQRVEDAVARALPARPRPAGHAQSEGDAGAERDRLPGLARLPPLVALEEGEAAEGEQRHRHAVLGVAAHLARRRVVPGLLHCRAVRPLLVALRPVGAERAQAQAGDDALARPGAGERAQRGEQRVGAGLQQGGVLEDAQRDVLGAARAQRHRPGLLPFIQAQRVVCGSTSWTEAWG